MNKIPLRVIHYGRFLPSERPGGVAAFAKNLELIFERVDHMSRKEMDVSRALRDRIPVICDSETVCDWPPGVPVIGFFHGLAAVKWKTTFSLTDIRLARAQCRAAGRPNTLWVACAGWIAGQAGLSYGLNVPWIVRHPVDTQVFDGRREGPDPRLVLHDARTRSKGKRLVERLASAFPDWRFEALDCPHDRVPDRMRAARAFLHLSRYEGNSIVCNEAMAMNLPCLCSDVGLFRDEFGPSDVFRVRADEVFNDRKALLREFRAFSESLDRRAYDPRKWVLEHASPEAGRAAWQEVMKDFLKSASRPGA